MIRTFAVIGDPIDHSLSPTIHNAAYRHLDLECTYIAYKIDKNELESGIESLKSIKVSGFNVTIPHKIRIMELLDDIDHDCKLIGAANTIVNDNGSLKGYNTDMDGFIEPIKNREIPIKNSNILLLGAGGASRAIIAGFAKEHAKKITIVNRTIEKAENLTRFSKELELDSDAISINDIEKLDGAFDFVVNASSLGLKNELNIVPTKLIDAKTTVYDIVYKPVNTELIKDAKKKDAQIIYGYEMLLSQAAKSFEIWLNQKAPYEAMKNSILGGF